MSRSSECVGHPDYDPRTEFSDVAYCMLSEPVLDVPRVPILAGCELDVLQPGVEVTIVGYGSDFGTVIDDQVSATGVGPKRYTTQTIDRVNRRMGEVDMLGPSDAQSACFGDSGGPALVQMRDGTWRVFGAAARLYTPDGLPERGNICGIGVTYATLTPQLEWLEAETGFDLTPCYDAQGQWSPSDACGDFPLAPGVGSGSWDDGCAGGAVGGGEELCEGVQGTSGGMETAGSDTSQTGSTTGAKSASQGTGDTGGESFTTGARGTSGAESSTGGSASEETAATRGSTSTDPAPPDSGGATTAAEDESADGCACAAAPIGSRSALATGAWMLLFVAGLRQCQ